MKADMTKERLITAGIKLFAKHGFESTTTRMIAEEAGVNNATMSFHFQNKENFYKAVLEYAAKDGSFIYDEVYLEIQELEEKGELNAQSAYALIERLIDIQFQFSIDEVRPDYLALMYWEQMHPPEGISPLTELATIRCEKILARLLTVYAPALSYEKAILLSRLINGGIIAYGEHPAFVNMIKENVKQQPLEPFVKDTLRAFILNSLKGLNDATPE
ncbi:TetR family transcriptional regulator [Christensenellaceae bacterium OttesenSCG-928-M15]|nr:TetR family transcriptional regulator [Christensenellaceae bacterium OttesenSCG-928-M15]